VGVLGKRPNRWRRIRQAFGGWASELYGWWQALTSGEGLVVGAALLSFALFILWFMLFALDWDHLVLLSRHGGRCVQYLSNEKAAFFIVGVLTAALLSTFFIAEAVHLYLNRRRLRRFWSSWLIGLGVTSTVLWLLLLYALSAWCI